MIFVQSTNTASIQKCTKISGVCENVAPPKKLVESEQRQDRAYDKKPVIPNNLENEILLQN